MKQVYYSITRTPRRAAILCLTTLGLSYAGIPTASAQQNPGTTYEVSLGNRGARNTVSDTTLTPGPLTSTAAGIEELPTIPTLMKSGPTAWPTPWPRRRCTAPP